LDIQDGDSSQEVFEIIASSEDLSYFVDEMRDLPGSYDFRWERIFRARSELREQGIESTLKNTIKSDLCFN